MVRRFPDNDGLEWYVLTTGYTEVGTVMKWTAQFKLAADDLDNFYLRCYRHAARSKSGNVARRKPAAKS